MPDRRGKLSRRDFITGAVTATAASCLSGFAADQALVRISANHPGLSRDWSKVRGFNYQPSWGSNDISIWCNFREDLFAHELDLGKKHFPGITVLRVWFSPNAWLENRDAFLRAAARAMQLMADRGLQMIPVYFNGWHSYPSWSGFTIEQLHAKQTDLLARQYTEELYSALARHGEVMLQDAANEPFNNGIRGNPQYIEIVRSFLEKITSTLRTLAPQTPICVGSGMKADDLSWVDPFVDVHALHPYLSIPGNESQTQGNLKVFESVLERLKLLGKPALATECCWGTNDDALRVEAVAKDLTILKQNGLGFLPHALHHSWVSDLHRPRPWQSWNTMYMGFIDPDGRIRPGHEVYNTI